MAYDIPVTRRTFLKLVGSSTAVAISVRSLPAMADACYVAAPLAKNLIDRHDEARLDVNPAWAPTPGTARWRIDGVPKVTGQKIYARDFKARDLNWPDEHWLYAVRCNRLDQAFSDIDLSMLSSDEQPSTIVDSKRVASRNINTSTSKNEPPLLAQPGQRPDFYGQPAALLIFPDFDTYRRARKKLDFNTNVVRYGAALGPPPPDPRGQLSFQESNVRAPEFPGDPSRPFDKSSLSSNDYDTYYASVGQQVRMTATAAQSTKGWLKVGTDDGKKFFTPAMDPVFLEPESGMAYYDSGPGVLRLLLGTQSPNDDATGACNLFKGSDFGISAVDVIACYPGGGFGGRDKSYFPLFLALAAPFAKGALRWQQSRFEQFQVGLKRCESTFTESLWVSPDGRFQAIDCEFVLKGGRMSNLQMPVAGLAAMSAMCCYDIPLARSHGAAYYTYDVFGGSQRGFGGPQAYLAIETLIDELADKLPMDPFALRRKNMLIPGKGKTITGAPILFELEIGQILSALESQKLWTERHRVARSMAAAGRGKYGVGFAMSNQAYGSGTTDGMFGMVEILPDATLRVHSTFTDMGNGAATTLGLAPSEALGQNAHSIAMSQIDVFNKLGLNNNCKSTNLAAPENFVDPLFVPAKPYGSSSSCLGAFHQHRTVQEAARALLLHSVLPAARVLWKTDAISETNTHWAKGKLVTQGKPPLGWPDLLKTIRSNRWSTVAAVHCSYTGGFWTFQYPMGSANPTPMTMNADYIAIGTDPGNLVALQRLNDPNRHSYPSSVNPNYGRDTYAPSGALVSVVVNPSTGHVKVEQVIAAVNTGIMICPPIVQGQLYGGIAMAIGNVLSEACKDGDDGPGSGAWNLDRYQILRMTDMPQAQLIPVTSSGDKLAHVGRGIGESVMCPIAPALLNAIAMATGRRFRTTPVTPEQVRGAKA